MAGATFSSAHVVPALRRASCPGAGFLARRWKQGRVQSNATGLPVPSRKTPLIISTPRRGRRILVAPLLQLWRRLSARPLFTRRPAFSDINLPSATTRTIFLKAQQTSKPEINMSVERRARREPSISCQGRGQERHIKGRKHRVITGIFISCGDDRRSRCIP